MLNIYTIELMFGLDISKIMHLCGLSEIFLYVYKDFILQDIE